jgi:RHS repeat-associated protein
MTRSHNISYNPGSNLPNEIMHPHGIIQNHYTLSGQKLGKKLLDLRGILIYHEQYYGDLVIKDGQPRRILHGDGVINLSNGTPEFHYHLKDHLGNVRLVITPDENNEPEVLQVNDYYPFGMAYTKNFQSGSGEHQPNKYLYNSKEEQEMPGKWLDYGWRMYDAQLGRWHGVDVLAEKYYPISPYAYVANNPMRFVDPDGKRIDDYFNREGKFLGADNAETDYVRIIDQQNWDNNKTIVENDIETIDHDIGIQNSVLFSEADISTEAALNVYNNYNTTDLTIEARKNETGAGGMAFAYTKESAKILINIQGNKSLGIADRASQIINMFVHEGTHYADYTNAGYEIYKSTCSNRKEQRAVISQMKHSSFKKTTPMFQQATINYGVRFGLINRMEPKKLNL